MTVLLCLLLATTQFSTTSTAFDGPVPATFLTSSRIVVVGDLHGDLENAIRVLMMANVTDHLGAWVGGTTILVQTGDVIDRGPYSRDLLDLFSRLKLEAPRSGGEVICLLGNHELMAFKGRLKYAHPWDIRAFSGVSNRTAAFGEDGSYGFVRDMPSIVVLHDTIFVHAGLHPNFASKHPDMVNSLVRDALRRNDHRAYPLHQFDGPQWYRGAIIKAMSNECDLHNRAMELVRKALGYSNVVRMVVGHTIQHTGDVGVFCNASLIAADISISRFNKKGPDHLAALLITPTSTLDERLAVSGRQMTYTMRTSGLSTSLELILPRSATQLEKELVVPMMSDVVDRYKVMKDTGSAGFIDDDAVQPVGSRAGAQLASMIQGARISEAAAYSAGLTANRLKRLATSQAEVSLHDSALNVKVGFEPSNTWHRPVKRPQPNLVAEVVVSQESHRSRTGGLLIAVPVVLVIFLLIRFYGAGRARRNAKLDEAQRTSTTLSYTNGSNVTSAHSRRGGAGSA